MATPVMLSGSLSMSLSLASSAWTVNDTEPLIAAVALSPTTVGGSFTGLTFRVIVAAAVDVSAPPLAVPPSSLTWNEKLA